MLPYRPQCFILLHALVLSLVTHAAATSNAPDCASRVESCSFLNATLQRCLQRCHDAMDGCERIAFHEESQWCAIGVAAGECSGAGWMDHLVAEASGCSYGRGRPGPASQCLLCTAGRASHAEVGDLAGVWTLTDGSNAAAGKVVISRAGVAEFTPSGARGQFVLWHPRADRHYPGAFLVERPETAGALPAGWDYAWIDDSNTDASPKLVIRRFCSAGPAVCPILTSPEGSPLFLQSLQGVRDSGPESPCEAIEGQDLTHPDATEGPCCSAAWQFAADVKTWSYADLVVNGVGSWSRNRLSVARWNEVHVPFSNLQGAALTRDANNPLMCSSTGWTTSGNTIVLAERGTCGFDQKALVAAQAGAAALLVINSDGGAWPEELLQGGDTTPTIPTWLMEREAGLAVRSAMEGSSAYAEFIGIASVLEAEKQRVCCDFTCKSRVTSASADTFAANLASECANVICTGFIPTTETLAREVLTPHNGECQDCPPGLVATQGSGSCDECGSGSQAASSSEVCEPCPAGTAGTFGSCTACPTGLEPDADRVACVQEGSGGGTQQGTTVTVDPGATTVSQAGTTAPSGPITVNAGLGTSEDEIPWAEIILGSLGGVVALICFCFCCYYVAEKGVPGVSGRRGSLDSDEEEGRGPGKGGGKGKGGKGSKGKAPKAIGNSGDEADPSPPANGGGGASSGKGPSGGAGKQAAAPPAGAGGGDGGGPRPKAKAKAGGEGKTMNLGPVKINLAS
mmetsp:Transcript_38240/g.89770  ORF Transcript_38240/g.89770 Transcript_38240/m.89770 type:complete len:741 (-) Transcript_38240:57-2279(-)